MTVEKTMDLYARMEALTKKEAEERRARLRRPSVIEERMLEEEARKEEANRVIEETQIRKKAHAEQIACWILERLDLSPGHMWIENVDVTPIPGWENYTLQEWDIPLLEQALQRAFASESYTGTVDTVRISHYSKWKSLDTTYVRTPETARMAISLINAKAAAEEARIYAWMEAHPLLVCFGYTAPKA